MFFARPGRKSTAERAAWRYLRGATGVQDTVDAEVMVDRATAATYRRLQRKVSTHGAIPESGVGFRGFCRVVLLNELRRALARSARRHARQLGAEEAATVVLSGRDGLVSVSWREIASVTATCCA